MGAELQPPKFLLLGAPVPGQRGWPELADLEEELEAMLREQDELDKEAEQGEQEEPDGEEGENNSCANVVDSFGLKDLMNK
eukprot:SAG22_NODE_3553_length_1646_cov_2.833226_2_plen_81_part_00